jgi:septum site-determining protein MinC
MHKGACELKSAQFSLMRLAIYQTDASAIQTFVADQVSAAPEFLGGAPVALDFTACGDAADGDFVEDLLLRLRYAGVQPIALIAETDSALAGIAHSLKLGLLAPQTRTKPDSAPRSKANQRTPNATDSVFSASPQEVQPQRTTPVPKLPVDAEPVVTPAARASSSAQTREDAATPQRDRLERERGEQAPQLGATQTYEGQVRAGQQIYAKGRDLIVAGAVGASSEVISDGSVHVYGRLMGKVIAGATGNRAARIYCLAFGAELVSIAGTFRVFETVPADLRGKAVQIWLDGDKLRFDSLN